MAKVLKVRDMTLGSGKPKICIPITGKNETELREEVSVVKTVCCDIVEWRVDHFEGIDDTEKVKETLEELKILLGRIPILFTCRTKKEGGEKDISSEDYIRLYREVIGTGNADLVDVEMMLGEEVCSTLLQCAHDNDVYVVTEKYADRPVISMSMGWLGSISRISGEFFGSSLTFGAAKHASAPGQLSVNDVNYILKVLHNTDND